MKKISLFLFVLFSVLISLPANAQKRHHLGVFGGANLANLSSDDLEEIGFDFSYRTAFGFGGVLDLGLSQNVALRFEPMYLQKGSKFPDIEEPDVQLKFKSAYVELPLFIKYAFGNQPTRPYLVVGPSIGFLLSADLVIEGEEDEDIKDDFKDIDFSLGFGGGVSFPFGNNSFFVEGRYFLGLANINDAEGEGADADIKNRGIQFMAGMTFPLGGNN